MIRQAIALFAAMLLSAPAGAQDLALLDPPGASAPGDLYSRAERARQRGDYDEAIALYTRTLQAEPAHVDALLQRGSCHLLTMRYDLAVSDLTAVIAIRPTHLNAYTARGAAYSRLGRFDKALEDFDHVLATDPADVRALNDRGWTLKGLGDAGGACRDWRSSKRLGDADAAIFLANNRCR